MSETTFAQLFAGRFDVYAEAVPHPHKPDKVSWVLRREPLTAELIQAHLDGTRRLGIYQLVDNYVSWFAVDFDAVRDDDGNPLPDAFALALKEAGAQADAFVAQGLFVYLERSRSLNGVHLWGFLEEPVTAAVVTDALRPLLLDAKSLDRMYPVQRDVSESGFGNLLALPYQGASVLEGGTCFVDRLGNTLPMDVFLRDVQRNVKYVLEDLAANAPKVRVKREYGERAEGSFEGRPARPVRGFLKVISQFGCKFMHHCAVDRKKLPYPEWYVAIGQCTTFEQGRDAAHLLSQGYKGYNPEEVDQLYDYLMGYAPHGCAYIHANFPEHACANCPMKAPYHLASKPILELAGDGVSPLEQQDWKRAVKRVRFRQTDEGKTGAEWGVAGLDRVTRLRAGEYIVIGARPSIGKTAFMVHSSLNVAERDIPAFVFSGETGEVPLNDRYMACKTGIDSRALRGEALYELTKHDYQLLEQAADALGQLPLFVNYDTTRPEQILALVEQRVLQQRIPLGKPYVVYMDYLQFSNTTDVRAGDSEYARLTVASSSFKYIAKILDQPFVVFSQLRRDAEGEDDEPALNSFRGTGQIEQDMDTGIIMTGQRVSGPVASRAFHFVKQREGAAGDVLNCTLHQTSSRFEARTSQADAPPRGDLFEGEPDGNIE